MAAEIIRGRGLFADGGEEAEEVGAGVPLDPRAAKDPTVMREALAAALGDGGLLDGAARMRDDFCSCEGPAGAADFIESRLASARV